MKIANKILIIGTAGFSKEVAHLIKKIDPHGAKWGDIFYVTENQAELGKKMPFGEVSYLDKDVDEMAEFANVVVAIGRPEIRKKITNRLKLNNKLCFPNIIHPNAEINLNYINMGVGNIVTSGVTMTCDISIGDFNVFNLNSTVGHDASIGSCNVVNPGVSISGWVKMGDGCLVGTGSNVLENVSVVSDAKIGAGAVVTKNIVVAGTYVGVPAKAIK